MSLMSKFLRTGILSVVAVVIALAAVSGNLLAAPPRVPPPSITFKIEPGKITGENQIPAGPVQVILQNADTTMHDIHLVGLKNGKSLADLQAALSKGLDAALGIADLYGGSRVVPGGTFDFEVELKPGTFVVLEFENAAKGLAKEFQVVPPSPQSEPPSFLLNPQVATVTQRDFAFAMPSQLEPDRVTWALTNRGAQPHEFVVIKIAQGKTIQDVLNSFANPNAPPPFEGEPFGLSAISPGQTAYFHSPLTVGNYLAVCFITDPKTQKPHVQLGMFAPFTVKAGGGNNAPATLPNTGLATRDYVASNWPGWLSGMALIAFGGIISVVSRRIK